MSIYVVGRCEGEGVATKYYVWKETVPGIRSVFFVITYPLKLFICLQAVKQRDMFILLTCVYIDLHMIMII